ncbi:MAG: glycerophosphodiester phosphodiesterase [Anaerolineae bacterium]|nr:glycerophosphodiester phosphodiesterase [Anaerolineae bacterium]
MIEHANNAWNRPFLRIGHGGAAGHAPANTLRSLTLALHMGVDMVEFDVRPCLDALVLLHDDSLWAFGQPHTLASASTLADLRRLDAAPDSSVPTLEEALDCLKGRALVNIDLKATGYEDAVLDQVHAKGMAGDVIYSSLYPSSLRRVRQLDPAAVTGLSYPEDRGNASSKPYLQPAVSAVVAAMRLLLPYRIAAMMRGADANAVMLYHKVVSRAAVKAVRQAEGKVFVWTVDDLDRVRQLRALQVDGVTSNHPELFAHC